MKSEEKSAEVPESKQKNGTGIFFGIITYTESQRAFPNENKLTGDTPGWRVV
ncbi:hypothetical protein V8J88_08505 [Massilia sp. W12]|uniref:hypothetical protein n=1 Tax=Massilia sp. W12 TaxID=3126507 RepID=UPI0030CDC86E